MTDMSCQGPKLKMRSASEIAWLTSGAPCP
ncbi:Protein of unknown function [Pyronema omphalodes CBS 100304]|uniref:Uncharacterized protein n=1 Tax=Pyronema omphalodes (strain CBS 100304) TaxID=1076935 RepID=U4LVE7_PYROM|nr:Protein of unknown function [Pyronema omphalodes CBS 100304]